MFLPSPPLAHVFGSTAPPQPMGANLKWRGQLNTTASTPRGTEHARALAIAT